MAHETPSEGNLVLPLSLTGPVDIGRLIREIEALDGTLSQQEIKGDTEKVKMPKTTLLLDKLIDVNKLNLLKAESRRETLALLNDVRVNAPVLHISFGADPAPSFTEKLITWLRQEIHPHVLVTIGLQPNIGAGCLVRSTNKYYDFSLRQNFTKNRDLLMSKLREVAAP